MLIKRLYLFRGIDLFFVGTKFMVADIFIRRSRANRAKALFGELVVLAAARILRIAWLCWRQLAGQAAALSPA